MYFLFFSTNTFKNRRMKVLSISPQTVTKSTHFHSFLFLISPSTLSPTSATPEWQLLGKNGSLEMLRKNTITKHGKFYFICFFAFIFFSLPQNTTSIFVSGRQTEERNETKERDRNPKNQWGRGVGRERIFVHL